MSLGFESSAVQLAAKVTFILAIAWVIYLTLSKWNPRWQVLLWRVAMVGVAVLLITSTLPSLYDVPLLPRTTLEAVTNSAPEATRGHRIESDLSRSNRNRPQSNSIPNTTESGPVDLFNATGSVSLKDPSQEIVRSQSANATETRPDLQQRNVVSHSAGWRQSWPRYGLALYALVLFLLISRLAIGLWIARREVAAATPAPDWIQNIAWSLAHESIDGAIPVRMTDRFESPVLCGVMQRVILLPSAMLRSSSVERDVKGAIAHELAHASGNDLIWDLLIATVAAIIWPIPFAWKTRAAHRTACERVSDRVAVDVVGDLEAYQSLVARIALRVSRATADIGLAMARHSEVRQRLNSLVRCPQVPRLGRNAVLIAVLLTIATCIMGVGSLVVRPSAVIAASEQRGDDEKPKPETTTKPEETNSRSRHTSLQFTVVRSDNDQPVANAKITVRIIEKAPPLVHELTTDADGKAKFEYPDGKGDILNLSAEVRKAGLVPVFVKLGQNLSPPLLPVEKTIRLDLGKKIGGQVVDPDGNPIADAKLTINNLLHDEKTSEDGKWFLDGAPLDVTGLSIRIDHPQFIGGFRQVQDRIDGRYVLDPGLKLAGRVIDQNRTPVAGATIEVSRRDPGRRSKEPRAVTAEDGSFVLYALGPESTFLIAAEAPQFAPQIKKIEPGIDTKPIEFVLEPGHTTRFKAVNTEGEPLAGVRIIADTWKGIHILRFEAKTDDNGFASWNGAPSDPVTFSVFSSGYASLRDVVAISQDEPHLIQLLRPLKIEGTVTDSEDKNVSAFRVNVGRKSPGRNEIDWYPQMTVAGSNGRFQSSCNETSEAVFIRVEATGFRTWVSEAIPFRDSLHKITVKLEAGNGPAGTVWSPDGQPVAGSRLMLATKESPLLLGSGYKPIQRSADNPSVVTDSQGHFEFPPSDAAAMVVAVHDSGYAEMPADKLPQSGGIRLQKWARIEVAVHQGKEPIAGATVALYPQVDPENLIKFHRTGITGGTNSEGRFTFDRVVPRKVVVSKTISQPLDQSRWQIYDERSTQATLLPGESVQVELGGSGATVTGRLIIAGNPPAKHEWKQNAAIAISPRPYNGEIYRQYRCLIDKDGVFRIDDIPPGKYELDVTLTPAVDPNVNYSSSASMGRVKREFEVTGDTPVVDLGVIESVWPKWLGVGDKAPLFVVPGIRREAVRLSDFRGQLLLIDFWTNSTKSLALMPKLAAIHTEFAADSRFQMLGLSLQSRMDEAESAVKQNGWPWAFGYAGQENSWLVKLRYDAQIDPECFLVDVDGTILYRGNDVDEIIRLIRKRLAELPEKS